MLTMTGISVVFVKTAELRCVITSPLSYPRRLTSLVEAFYTVVEIIKHLKV